MKPFNNIFNTLRPGISNGPNYNRRKRNFLKRGEEYIVPRKLSENDFVVIKEASARGREEHIAAIKLNGKIIMDHWCPILCGFLSNDEPLINSKKKKRKVKDVVATQPMKSRELQQSGVSKSVVAVGSSSAHPLLVCSDDLPETALATGGQKRRNLWPTHADEEERLPFKRKLDFSQENDFSEPITLDGPSIDVELSSFVNDEDFGHVLTGEKDHGLGDLFDLSVEDYTFGECGTSYPPSSPGCDQEIRHSPDPEVMVVSGKGAQMDCSFIKDMFMDATDFIVKRALKGLNDSTLGDPERRIMLESVSQTLPTQVPEVAKVQAMLVGLIDLSKKLESGQTEFTKESERDEHVVAEIELNIKFGHEVSKDIIGDLSAVENKCTEMEAQEAELKAQLEEVTATLHKLKLEMEQRRQAHDAHQSEQKKLLKSLQDTNAGKRTRLAKFKQKTTDLKTEASQLLNNLQNWRAP
ncbi:hypothetical protein CFC21_053112 [Triticum aestivum]|uniref:Uncharacterized protein n=2 Tax=Triticum aestivum TaxID=4565 RepID=A0A3B6HUY1_WHEAT|nr:uncharacterized protein LOC123082245 isoform X2 [Triticum aestivum]KAF7043802.1 hypothetical protein CFC21_053112 [Triticum aestivum]